MGFYRLLSKWLIHYQVCGRTCKHCITNQNPLPQVSTPNVSLRHLHGEYQDLSNCPRCEGFSLSRPSGIFTVSSISEPCLTLVLFAQVIKIVFWTDEFNKLRLALKTHFNLNSISLQTQSDSNVCISVKWNHPDFCYTFKRCELYAYFVMLLPKNFHLRLCHRPSAGLWPEYLSVFDLERVNTREPAFSRGTEMWWC